jgi:hypothetical protein
MMAQVQLGGDPEASKREAGDTVRSVIDQYLESKKDELRPSSFKSAELYLTGYYFKPLPHPAYQRRGQEGCRLAAQ